MRKLTVVLLLALSCVLGAVFGLARGFLRRPSVSIPEVSFDFGRIARGEKLTHAFAIENLTKDPLTIEKIQSSCACLLTRSPEKTIAPRGKGKVELTLLTGGLVGEQGYSCMVRMKGSKKIEPVELSVQAVVYTPTADFCFDRVFFGDVLRGTSASKRIPLVNEDVGTAEWKIVDVSTSSSVVSAEYRESERAILCSLSGAAPIGPIRETISVDVREEGRTSRLSIAVAGRVVGPLRTRPESLFLGLVEGGSVCERRLRVSCLEKGERKHPLALTCSEKNLELTPVEASADECSYDLSLQVPETRGYFEGRIRLATNHPTSPILEVSFSGLSK